MESSTRLVDLRLTVAGLPEKTAALKAFVPSIAKEAVQQIERELPDYVRPHDHRYADVISEAVEWVIRHFLDLMVDPDLSSAEILGFFREIGVGEAKEGRSLDTWQGAMRIGAGVAVRRLADESERLGQGFSTSDMSQVAQGVFQYLDHLASIVAQGHAETEARATGELQNRRRTLLDLLLNDTPPQQSALVDPAIEARWTLPRSIAAVALHERRRDAHRPAVPPDVLLGMHADEPFLIVPDPDGPGRHHMMETGLRDWVAAIGPTVEVTDANRSLRWARDALRLARQGVIQADKPFTAEAHMPIMIMMNNRELVERVMNRRLGPMAKLRPTQRYRLTETLLASIECGFNATEVSRRLHVHAQTIRYRFRQLEGLFGADIYDPAQRLELHIVVQAWLATHQEPDTE